MQGVEILSARVGEGIDKDDVRLGDKGEVGEG